MIAANVAFDGDPWFYTAESAIPHRLTAARGLHSLQRKCISAAIQVQEAAIIHQQRELRRERRNGARLILMPANPIGGLCCHHVCLLSFERLRIDGNAVRCNAGSFGLALPGGISGPGALGILGLGFLWCFGRASFRQRYGRLSQVRFAAVTAARVYESSRESERAVWHRFLRAKAAAVQSLALIAYLHPSIVHTILGHYANGYRRQTSDGRREDTRSH